MGATWCHSLFVKALAGSINYLCSLAAVLLFYYSGNFWFGSFRAQYFLSSFRWHFVGMNFRFRPHRARRTTFVLFCSMFFPQNIHIQGLGDKIFCVSLHLYRLSWKDFVDSSNICVALWKEQRDLFPLLSRLNDILE